MKNTYIYIKESPLGLKYLGKTVSDPYEYKGSGKKWKLHLKKHNITANQIKTTILCETNNYDKLKELGLYYSNFYDIVNSSNWANLKPEEGDGGATRNGMKHSSETKKLLSERKIGDNNPMKRPEMRKLMSEIGKNRIHSNESNKKRSEALKGKKRPLDVVEKIKKGLTGKKLSEEHKQSLKGKRNPYGEQPKIKCIHCGLEGGKNSINRWHNDKCKNRVIS